MEGANRSRMAQSRAPSSNGAAAVDLKPSLYGDVFGSGPPGKWPPTAHPAKPPRPSEYAEIFGGFAASCAIPVLDLPPVADHTQDLFRSCSALDYLDIFGGLDDAGFGVSYEELFDGHKRNEGSRTRPEDERNGMGTILQSSAASDSFIMELERANATILEKDQSSPNRITCGLNNEKMHANGAHKMAHITSRDNAIDMRRNASEVYATTEFTFMDSACPPSLIDADNNPACPMNMNPVKNSVLHDEIYPSYSKKLGSTYVSYCSAGGSGNNQDTDEKNYTVKSNHEDISASEQYHSCSSENSNDGDSYFNEPSTGDGSFTSAVYDEITKVDCSKRETEAVPASSVKLKNDLTGNKKQSDIKFTASENFPRGITTSQLNYDHGQNSGLDIKKTNKDVSEETALPMSEGSMKISGQILGDNKQQVQAFSNTPSSNRDRPSSDGAFLTVFDINLQTQPSQLPPPSRPPPRLTPDLGNFRMGNTKVFKVHPGECGNGPATSYQMKQVSMMPESQTRKWTVKSNSPPFYAVELDASSAAAASVAAVKEAMEQAEAKLKRTKESMVRIKDNIQMKKKMGISESSKFKEMGENEPAITQRFSEVSIPNIIVENNHERSGSVAKQVENAAAIDKAVPYDDDEEKHFNLAEKSLRYMQDSEQGFPTEVERADEWKVDQQFFELVNNEKKFKKVSDVSIQNDEKMKLKAVVSAKDEKGERSIFTRLAANLEHNDTLRYPYIDFKTEDDDKREKETHKDVGIIEVSKSTNDKMKEDSMDTSSKEIDAAGKTDPEGPACEDVAEPKVTSDFHQPDKVHCSQEGKEVRNDELKKKFETHVEACSHIYARHDLKSDDKTKEDSMDTIIKEIDAAHKTDSESPACEDGVEPKVASDFHKPDKIHCPQQGKEVSDDELKFFFETHVESCSHIHARHLESDDKDYNCKEAPKNVVKEEQSKFCEAVECKDVLGSVIKENNSRDLEETSVCQSGTKDINEASIHCNQNHTEMQSLETNEELREHLMEQTCWEKAETKGPEETVTATESTFYDEEIELNGEKTAMAAEGETQELEDTKKSCEDEESENVSQKFYLSEENNRETATDEDTETYSRTVEEKETTDEHWQYFCEKLIKESEIEFHPSEEKQEAAKAGGENVSGKESLDSLSVDEIRKNEGSDDFKMAKIRNHNCTSDEFYQSGQREKKLEDAEASSPHNSNGLPKASQGISNPCNPEGLVKPIPEILKNIETLKKEINEREMEEENEKARKLEEEREREREREKDRVAFDKSTLEYRERAFTEARERAGRAAVEKVTAEFRKRALAEAQEKAEKALADALSSSEKASREARLRAERAAVDRANAEARERAAERALAEQATREARAERSTMSNWQRKNSDTDGNPNFSSRDNQGMKQSTKYCDMYEFSREPQRHSDSSNHVPHSKENISGHEGESAIRSRARWERHQRTSERAAKALAEKNLRDVIAQREQSERNRLSETLDADVRRWSSGKEGNLRALLSTLQYILGTESGWQPIPLTDVITAAAVKKAYRKATLCVHPDKLQQRGANIQQKYICEKVFDLLKEAWNRFNSEERCATGRNISSKLAEHHHCSCSRSTAR